MTSWISEWATRKRDVANRLASGECGGSYGEAALILCSVLSALAAATWKGERIDRKRFVEILQRYAPQRLQAMRISIPLLVRALRESGRFTEMDTIRKAYLNHGNSQVLIGEDVDCDESKVLRICSTIPERIVRECSYANVLYREVRSGYAHEYRPGKRADSWPMTGRTDATVSYVNWANDRDRHIHFHIPWLSELTGSIANALDSIADKLPLAHPFQWWVDGKPTPKTPMLTGIIVGYDPGGNGTHGLAELHIKDGESTSLLTNTAKTTEEVIRFLQQLSPILAIGVDTLTCWSTGASGWRPADRWLRERYPEVENSITSPNALRGSMSLNGMAVLVEARGISHSLAITETHPKVLNWYLSGVRYDYAGRKVAMDKALALALGLDVAPANEHEWDAATSALAAFEGISGRWNNDLHRLPTTPGEHFVWPCGETNFFWPE